MAEILRAEVHSLLTCILSVISGTSFFCPTCPFPWFLCGCQNGCSNAPLSPLVTALCSAVPPPCPPTFAHLWDPQPLGCPACHLFWHHPFLIPQQPQSLRTFPRNLPACVSVALLRTCTPCWENPTYPCSWLFFSPFLTPLRNLFSHTLLLAP